MRKTIFLFMACLIAFGLASCVGNQSKPAPAEDTTEVDTLPNHAAFEMDAETASAGESPASSEVEAETSTTGQSHENSQSTSSTSTSSTKSADGKNFIGVYEFTDPLDQSWFLNAKSDGSAIIGIKGLDNVAYGSWEYYSDGCVQIKFSNEIPMIMFPSTKEFDGLGYIKNGYLYYSGDDLKAKNPRNRIPIKKNK